MKKTARDTDEMDLKPEYDFRGGERGKFAQRYASGTNLVLLAPDVAEVYPNSDAVNNALRILIQASRRSTVVALTKTTPSTSKREHSRSKRVAVNS